MAEPTDTPRGTRSRPGNLFAAGRLRSDPAGNLRDGVPQPLPGAVDQKTGWVLLGDYGPDAGADRTRNRGPDGHVELNDGKRRRATTAGPTASRTTRPSTTTTTSPREPQAQKFDCAEPGQRLAQQYGPSRAPAGARCRRRCGWARVEPRTVARPRLRPGRRADRRPANIYDESQPDRRQKFPPYYDGEWFIAEWNLGWIKTGNARTFG